jgi:hypothetical protein
MGRFSNVLAYCGAVVRTREPIHGKMTPGEANVRVPIQIAPQEAPDTPKQGLIPSRPAMVQVATYFHDTTKTQEDRFVAVLGAPAPRAAMPRGRQVAWADRSNIRVPPHIAYGSMFTQADPIYGLG